MTESTKQSVLDFLHEKNFGLERHGKPSVIEQPSSNYMALNAAGWLRVAEMNEGGGLTSWAIHQFDKRMYHLFQIEFGLSVPDDVVISTIETLMNRS